MCNRIFQFTKNLKGLKNELDQYFFVDLQLPEPLKSEKIDREQKLRKIKKENDEIPEENKVNRKEVKIKNKTLYVNSVPQRPYVYPPQ